MVEQKKKLGFIYIVKINECEGKDNAMAQAEYSIVGAQESDAQCSQESIETTVREMIAYGPNKERTVINLVELSNARFPAGGNSLFLSMVKLTKTIDLSSRCHCG